MTANNIQSSRNPITGMTIAEIATAQRWCDSDEGKAMSSAYSRYLSELEPANEGTVVDTTRQLLEARHQLEAIESSSILDDVEATLRRYGIQ